MRFLFVAGWCVLTCAAASQSAVAQEVSDGMHRRDYLDDDDQRRLADLQFAVDVTGRHGLVMTISAIGPAVEPISGFRGIAGANRYTAEELGLILSARHDVEVVTYSASGNSVSGQIVAGAFGRLPERRLLPDAPATICPETELPLAEYVTTSTS